MRQSLLRVWGAVNLQMPSNTVAEQAQGSNPPLEKSSAWDSPVPITAKEGLQRLDSVWNSLTATQKKDRQKAYECAKNFILNAQKITGSMLRFLKHAPIRKAKTKVQELILK